MLTVKVKGSPEIQLQVQRVDVIRLICHKCFSSIFSKIKQLLRFHS